MFIDTPPWSRERTWPPEPVSVSHARHFLRETLDLRSLQAVGDDAAVVLSELATNAVIHACTDFTVSLSPSGKQAVRLSVTDGSTLMPQRVSNSHATGGRGLELINALSTEWGATLNGVEGKTIWAVLSPHRLLDQRPSESASHPEVLGGRPPAPGRSMRLGGGGRPSAGSLRHSRHSHAVTLRHRPPAARGREPGLGGRLNAAGEDGTVGARWGRCARSTITGCRQLTPSVWLPHHHCSGSPPK